MEREKEKERQGERKGSVLVWCRLYCAPTDLLMGDSKNRVQAQNSSVLLRRRESFESFTMVSSIVNVP